MARPRRSAKTQDDLTGVRIVIVEARFYDDIADALLAGATRALDAAGAVYDRITLKQRQPTSLIGVAGNGGTRNDVIAVAAGTVLYVVFLVWLHPLLIGTSPLPH